jgi:5-methylcytosine-specific restriction protein A
MPWQAPRFKPIGSPTVQARRETNRERMAREHHSGVRMRGRKGQEARTLWLAMHPLCAACERVGILTAATTVDHIVPVSQGGADHPDNYQSLCVPHHREKTREERRR